MDLRQRPLTVYLPEVSDARPRQPGAKTMAGMELGHVTVCLAILQLLSFL